MAKIQLFIKGNLQGQYPLEENCEIRVGRSTHCDIIIQNADISRHHCSFKFGRGQWVVVDADSANGTFVNGECVRERVLRHKDRVSLGQHAMLFDQYGSLPAEALMDIFHEGEESGRPSTVLLYRDELVTMLEGSQKCQAMGLVLAAERPSVVPLVKEKTSLGSDWACDLRLSGLFVKPIQAWVLGVGEGHVLVRQPGPREVYLNGRKLDGKEALLQAGDVFEIAGNKIFYGGL